MTGIEGNRPCRGMYVSLTQSWASFNLRCRSSTGFNSSSALGFASCLGFGLPLYCHSGSLGLAVLLA